MLTNEETALKVAELQGIILNKVKFYPFGEITQKLGYISGINVDKRTNSILLAIVCEDGSKVYKTWNAKYLEILPEKVENTKISQKSTQNLALVNENSQLKAKISELELELQKLTKKLEKFESKK